MGRQECCIFIAVRERWKPWDRSKRDPNLGCCLEVGDSLEVTVTRPDRSLVTHFTSAFECTSEFMNAHKYLWVQG